MGMRRNIALQYGTEKPEIYLYTHWDAQTLHTTLAFSLDRARERWSDASYLARVIFTDMTKSAGDDLTGYGLAPYEMDEEYPTITVHLENKTVNGVPFEDFVKNPQMFAV